MRNSFNIDDLFPWFTETKEEVTKKYIQGLITKEEYIERMDKITKGEK